MASERTRAKADDTYPTILKVTSPTVVPGPGTEITINGRKLRGITGIDLQLRAGEITTATLYLESVFEFEGAVKAVQEGGAEGWCRPLEKLKRGDCWCDEDDGGPPFVGAAGTTYHTGTCNAVRFWVEEIRARAAQLEEVEP